MQCGRAKQQSSWNAIAAHIALMSKQTEISSKPHAIRLQKVIDEKKYDYIALEKLTRQTGKLAVKAHFQRWR